MKVCTIEGCTRRLYSRGWCATHWARWRRNGDPTLLQYQPTPKERFDAAYDLAPNGCWTWTSKKDGGGYAVLSIGRQNHLAHRWAYETFVRPIPDGLVVDHLCRNRACVNPAHMDLVTNRENVLRGMSPSAVIRRQGVCKRGHQMVGHNVYVPPSKPQHQQCRTCRATRAREAHARKSAA